MKLQAEEGAKWEGRDEPITPISVTTDHTVI